MPGLLGTRTPKTATQPLTTQDIRHLFLEYQGGPWARGAAAIPVCSPE
ncbi:hypothetical protein ART_2973 [Arthrobacter sp. PAMC 25486]|nr:hypothetical protein ART_2973 [Arthrobacter sp. PAMC 25486]